MLINQEMKKNSDSMISKITSFVLETIILLLLFFTLRSLIFEPFRIPSGSMKSTLLVGDFIFVTKYDYGYTKYSFPFSLNLFKGRIFSKQPKAGDVVVFRPPKNTSVNYIKRVIGLPGDKIQIKRGILHINDKGMGHNKIDDFYDIDDDRNISRYEEVLYDEKDIMIHHHHILEENPNNPLNNTLSYIVPKDHIFVLGDNRDNSRDSRFFDLGCIPIENIVGRARVVPFSFQKIKNDIISLRIKLNLDRIWRYIV